MNDILVRVLVLASMVQLGLFVDESFTCKSDLSNKQVKSAFQNVLRIRWKPISVFPNEAARFSPRR